MAEPKTPVFALAGNPNCGKTTLFNLLTGKDEPVGNRAGVTFSAKKAPIRRYLKQGASLVDLPGIYALSPYGQEERIADEYLKSGDADAVINIADATNLERALLLTLQLIRRGVRTVLALNMMDEVEREGIRIDIPALAARLGIPVLPISAAKARGVDALMRAVSALLSVPKQPPKEEPNARRLLSEAHRIAAEAVTHTGKSGRRTDAIDRIICRPAVGIPLFFGILALVFALTFSAFGRLLSDGISSLSESLGGYLSEFLLSRGVAPPVLFLLQNGILNGVCAVLSFLPQIAVLFFLLELLEDVGYLSRAAFAMDGVLRPLGLSGKAFIPMLLGFGCTVPAALSTVTLDEKEQERVLLSLPFLPCSARFSVFALLIGAFFSAHRVGMALFLYALGIAVAFGSALFSAKHAGDGAPPLTVELPKYRLPCLRNLLRAVLLRIREFLLRAGTVVFLSCVAVSLLDLLSPALHFAAEPEESLLFAVGRFLAPLFAPIGLGEPRIIAALLSGFFAKESVISTLEILTGGALGSVFTTAGAASFCVFVLLYTPCVATLSVLRRRLGRKKALLSFLRCFAVAYGMSFLVYTFFRLFA